MKKLLYPVFAVLFVLLTGLAQAQTDNELGLHSEGGAWNFYPSAERDESLKNVLLIGDSVMNGFHQSVIDSLKTVANVDYWLTPKHLKSDHLFSDLEKVVSFRKYDVIQFNIGLHGWPEGRIGDDEYVPQLETYIRTLEAKAGDARLIWASITPVTEQDRAVLNKDINPVIAARNVLAERLMNSHGITVNYLYGLLVDKLQLARLDRFHWQAEGYSLMASQTVKYILHELDSNVRLDAMEKYNVVWRSGSANSLGSMPAGNGDIGVNLWVEENGDLQFYLSKTDAWSENARLLKIGKVRLSLSPNPFTSGKRFLQELKLCDGVIHIEAGEGAKMVSLDIWIDANHPVVEIDVKSETPVDVRVSTEPWRVERRRITGGEMHSAYGLMGDGGPDVYAEKDIILDDVDDGVIWLHRNERSLWRENLELQGLGTYTSQSVDPLLYRTFGALIRSSSLVKKSPVSLESDKAQKQYSISVYALTAQTKTQNAWTHQIVQLAERAEALSRSVRFSRHKRWWRSFWCRSYIDVHAGVGAGNETISNVNRGYVLQRYMNACSGRGNSPIKFNGSIFTVDTIDLEGKFHGYDADYRQWGGAYWWQNTRLPYWSMLESGDFDLMRPLFAMYREALPLRKLAAKCYYNHEGAFFPETMYHWGTYTDSNYGRDRSELPLGMTMNRYIRYYWQSGLELSLMMLDYYSFTRDDTFLAETLLPVVTAVIDFYDQHWGRDEHGQILFEPAMALETYNTAKNPLPEIVGIEKVCTELLRLPESMTDKDLRQQWKRLINELPEIPTETVDGELRLAPAEEYSGKQNVENPELYAIFPYRTFGVGKDGLKLARRSFANRAIKRTGGWQQNAIKAALLGLSGEASQLTAENFNSATSVYRFPTMWGPNYDWTPDQCHGSVAMTALQRMLVQYDGDRIYLLPAWTKDWDVVFKLHAPQKTIISGVIRDGKIEKLTVLPIDRIEDVIICRE